MSKLQVRNEAVINAPVGNIWTVITSINWLHKTNPGIIKATGSMDKQGDTRTCEFINQLPFLSSPAALMQSERLI